MAASKGRNVPRNRKDPKKIRDVGIMSQGLLGPAASVGAGISGMMGPKEEDYPTSAPSTSKRPKARPAPKRPKARPAKIEQEAAEAAAVARGNAAAERRAREEAMMGMKDGGKLKMVKGPGGKMVPDYAADGVGKMAYGGKMKKVKKTSWVVKCEEFCPSLPGCGHGCKSSCGGSCDTGCDSDCCGDPCASLKKPMVPPKCGKVRCRKKLVKKTITCEIPSYKCIVVCCNAGCNACCDESDWEKAAPAKAPASTKRITPAAPLPPGVGELQLQALRLDR